MMTILNLTIGDLAMAMALLTLCPVWAVAIKRECVAWYDAWLR